MATLTNRDGVVIFDGEITPAGGIPDPITDPLNVATTDANDVPLFLQLPTGFLAGASDWIEVDDENSVRVFAANVDGQVTIIAPVTGSGGTLSLLGDGTTARTQFEIGNAANATTLHIRPAIGQTSAITVANADGNGEHQLVSGATVGTGRLGFYGHATVAQQQGVAVNAGAIHAALVNLGLITA